MHWTTCTRALAALALACLLAGAVVRGEDVASQDGAVASQEDVPASDAAPGNDGAALAARRKPYDPIGGLPPGGSTAKCGPNDFDINKNVNISSPTCTAQSCGGQCNPDSCCSDISKTSDQLWQYCLPNLAAPCDTRVNYACDKCSLWWVASASDGWCRSGKLGLCLVPRVRGPDTTTIQIASSDAAAKLMHWKAVPNVRGIRGMEDISQRGNVESWQDDLWSDTWAQLLVTPVSSLPFGANPPLAASRVDPESMGMHINSAWTRTFHQMHIHLGHRDGTFQSNLEKKAASLGVSFLVPGNYTVVDNTACKPKVAFLTTARLADVNPFSIYSAAVASGKWPRDIACGQFSNKARYYTSILLVKANAPWRCRYAGAAPSACDRGYIVFLLADVGDVDTLSYRTA